MSILKYGLDMDSTPTVITLDDVYNETEGKNIYIENSNSKICTL